MQIIIGDYWEELEKKNPEFKINRRAFSLYCQSLSSEECNMGFNEFCESEEYKSFRTISLREEKLERICK